MPGTQPPTRGTTFGRSNAGTVRGDQEIADRYLNLFFRI
jgi:hypothetical protein